MDYKILEKSGMVKNQTLLGEEYWVDDSLTVTVFLKRECMKINKHIVYINSDDGNTKGMLAFDNASELAVMLRLCDKISLANNICSNI